MGDIIIFWGMPIKYEDINWDQEKYDYEWSNYYREKNKSEPPKNIDIDYYNDSLNPNYYLYIRGKEISTFKIRAVKVNLDEDSAFKFTRLQLLKDIEEFCKKMNINYDKYSVGWYLCGKEI